MQRTQAPPGAPGNLPGSVAMKAPKIEPHLNSLTVASHHKAKNTLPAGLSRGTGVGSQPCCTPQQRDATRLAFLRTLQAQIEDNTYRIDGAAIAQRMLASPVARRMLDIDE